MTTTLNPLTPSTGPRSQGLVLSEWLGLALVFGIGLFGYLMQTIDWFQYMPGDLGDGRFNSIVLEHLYQWVTGHAPGLWSPGFFFPFEGALAFSDNHFGSGASYVLARSLGFGRETAFLLWFLTGNILNFWVCWWVLHRLGFSVFAAALGAFVFAFALPVLHKENHAQLVYRFAIPLAFAAWYRALALRHSVDWAKTAFWWSVQVLCSIYLGVFLAYLLLASLIAYWVCQYFFAGQGSLNHHQAASGWGLAPPLSSPGRFKRVCWTVIAALATVLALYVLRKYQQVAADYHFARSVEELQSMLPRLASYLLGDGSRLTGWIGKRFNDIPMRHEQQMFFGLGPWVLVVAGTVYAWIQPARTGVMDQRVQLVRVASIALLVLFAMTLSVNGHSLYLLMAKLPGVGSIRAVSRIVLVMLVPVALLVAFAADRLLRTCSSGYARVLIGLALIVLVTCETVNTNHLHVPRQQWLNRQLGLSSAITAPLPPGSILFVTQDKDDPFFMTEIDAVIYAQDHNLRTLNGYSGNVPPGYQFPDPCVDPKARVDAYFAHRGPDDARRQSILSQLRVVSPKPCVKPPGGG